MKKILIALTLCFSISAMAQTCTLTRTANGNIKRSASEVYKFRKANPCPATGKTIGSCLGYQVEHTSPLCACGPDKVANMTWMATTEHKIKTKVDIKNCIALKKSGAVK